MNELLNDWKFEQMNTGKWTVMVYAILNKSVNELMNEWMNKLMNE